jgi:pimeloyl-ACP methyl ester carboxylesterase
VVDALDWLAEQPLTASLRCGLFGSSTGAAAALVAAARRPGLVDAVVSRGGRVDLADPVLHHVRAPCLFIVGGDDLEVVELNRISMDRLEIESRMVVIEGAGHLFEEPGALEQVSEHAGEWFERLLRPRTEYEPLPLQP